VLICDRRGVIVVDKPHNITSCRYEYGEAIVDFDQHPSAGFGVELCAAGGLTDGKLALVKKTKNQVELRDYSDRGSYADLGRNLENQLSLVKPQFRVPYLNSASAPMAGREEAPEIPN